MRSALKLEIVIAIVLMTFAGLATAGAEDLTIVSRVTPAKGSPATSTQYITSDKMRISDGQTDTIVDLASGKLIHVDHKKKQFYETTFEEMKRHFAQLEELLDSNPMMAKMLGEMSTVDVQKQSGTREIAGYSCQDYLLSMGEKFKQTVCITSELEFPIQYYDAHKMLYAMMGPMAARFEKMFEKMKELGGYALATDIDTKVMGFDASSSTEVTEVKKGAIPADAFTPPSGYKQKKSPLGG